MKKVYYFLSLMAVVLMLPGHIRAHAVPASTAEEGGKTVYGVINRDDDFHFGSNGAIVKFDSSDPYNTVENLGILADKCQAGAMAENKYYVISQGDEVEFGYVDFEKATFHKIGAGMEFKDMTYDASTKTLYGIAIEWPNSVVYKIDPEKAEYTKAGEWEVMLEGLASDGNGSIYTMSSKKLYKIDTTKSKWELNEACNLTTDLGSYFQSIIYDNGLLYWSASVYEEGDWQPHSIWSTIDVKDGTIKKVGDAAGTFPGNIRIVGLSFAAPSGGSGGGDTPNKATRVTMTKTFGDVMVVTDECTQMTLNYYDGNNNLVRSLEKGYGLASKEWMPTNLRYYIYNEEGQLTESYYRQYGQYQGYDCAWGEKTGFVTYKYNDAGKLIEKKDSLEGSILEYEWEGDNIVKETKQVQEWGSEEYSILYTKTYSDFVEGAKNCPRKVVSDGKYDSDKYTGEYTYNEANQPVVYITTNAQNIGLNKEEWTYNEDGRLTQYITYNYSLGDWVPNYKNVYTINGNETKIVGSTYFDKVWTEDMTYRVEYADEYNRSTAPTDLEVAIVSTEESPNTVKLTCHVPQEVITEFPAWDIFRNGEKIARVTTLTDEGILEYTDKELVNDNYDYFVQTVDSQEEIGYNVSNAVNLDVITELLPVTDLKCTGYKVEEVSDPMTGLKYDANIATLTWKASDSPYKVVAYNVYVDATAKLPVATIEGTEANVSFGESKVAQVFVETVFSIGRVRTEVLEIDLAKIDNVQNETMAPLMTLDGRTLTVHGDCASLVILNANGQMIERYNKVSSINLSQLPAGIYIARMESNGKLQTVKLVVN